MKKDEAGVSVTFQRSPPLSSEKEPPFGLIREGSMAERTTQRQVTQRWKVGVRGKD